MLKKGKNEVSILGGNSVINQEKVSIVGGERTEALLMRYWLHLLHQDCFLSFTFLQGSNHPEKTLTLHVYLLQHLFLITGRLHYLIIQWASLFFAFIFSPGSKEQLLFCKSKQHRWQNHCCKAVNIADITFGSLQISI